MKLQGRFRHCFKPGNEWTIAAAQEWVDERWEKLQNKCE
jgi:pyruvate ferredoxin oxidoreductase beta subunit